MDLKKRSNNINRKETHFSLKDTIWTDTECEQREKRHLKQIVIPSPPKKVGIAIFIIKQNKLKMVKRERESQKMSLCDDKSVNISKRYNNCKYLNAQDRST